MPLTPLPLLLGALLTLPTAVLAQTGQLTSADSALVYRILNAEDRREASAAALSEGTAHPDTRIQTIARRALGRISDSTYAARGDLPLLAARVTWPLPMWRVRYDSLRTRRHDCAALATASADSVLQVRLRAIDLIAASCDSSAELRTLLTRNAVLPRPSGGTPQTALRWHEGAHSIVALARVWPAGARDLMRQLVTHPQWQVRMYTARAAEVTTDTALLRRLVRDRDNNVKEAAIEALARLTGHADDTLFLRALNSTGAQAVRAAATALKGTTHPDAPRLLDRALRRWLARPNDSERDARLALLAAAGRPATEDRPFSAPAPLPAEAVALALGAEVRLRVTLAPESGGGSFIVRLRGDAAPITAARVFQLARRRYYDNTTWHRVIPDFVIQGGGHGANEYVGLPRFFRDELGPLSHLRGGVGMSTRGHDTGDGQWFVDLSDLARLDRDYTLFGEVIEGMAVVDGILEGDRIASIRPVE